MVKIWSNWGEKYFSFFSLNYGDIIKKFIEQFVKALMGINFTDIRVLLILIMYTFRIRIQTVKLFWDHPIE